LSPFIHFSFLHSSLLRLALKLCFQCKKPVLGTRLTAGPRQYHVGCLSCSKCYKIISPNTDFYLVNNDPCHKECAWLSCHTKILIMLLLSQCVQKKKR
jgi:hypothetical protein